MLASVANTLNQLVNERESTPYDVIRTATDGRELIERIDEELDTHKQRSIAEALGCKGIIAVAQRLKEESHTRSRFQGITSLRC